MFPLDGAGQCAGKTFPGRKQAQSIVVKLYNNDRNNANIEQRNALIFPLELSRTISTLIQATESHEVVEDWVLRLVCDELLRIVLTGSKTTMHFTLII